MEKKKASLALSSLAIVLIVAFIAVGIGVFNVNIAIPVSYTHLDVYKRQEYHLTEPDTEQTEPSGAARFCWQIIRILRDLAA